METYSIYDVVMANEQAVNAAIELAMQTVRETGKPYSRDVAGLRISACPCDGSVSIAIQPAENLNWHSAAKDYLEKLGLAEFEEQRIMYKGNPKRFRYTPSQYHRDLIACLDCNDEESFKALKLASGYASAYKS